MRSNEDITSDIARSQSAQRNAAYPMPLRLTRMGTRNGGNGTWNAIGLTGVRSDGLKTFNTSVPVGTPVRGLPLFAGGIALDHQNIVIPDEQTILTDTLFFANYQFAQIPAYNGVVSGWQEATEYPEYGENPRVVMLWGRTGFRPNFDLPLIPYFVSNVAKNNNLMIAIASTGATAVTGGIWHYYDDENSDLHHIPVFVSGDRGRTWRAPKIVDLLWKNGRGRAVNDTERNEVDGYDTRFIAICATNDGGFLIGGGAERIYKSLDGENWDLKQGNIPEFNSDYFFNLNDITQLINANGTIWAFSTGSNSPTISQTWIRRSLDNGNTWEGRRSGTSESVLAVRWNYGFNRWIASRVDNKLYVSDTTPDEYREVDLSGLVGSAGNVGLPVIGRTRAIAFGEKRTSPSDTPERVILFASTNDLDNWQIVADPIETATQPLIAYSEPLNRFVGLCRLLDEETGAVTNEPAFTTSINGLSWSTPIKPSNHDQNLFAEGAIDFLFGQILRFSKEMGK